MTKDVYGGPDMGVKGFGWVWSASDGCMGLSGYVEGLG